MLFAMEMYPDLFHDSDCIALFDKIECEFSKQGKLRKKVCGIMAATRQYDMITACKQYTETHPNAAVVNLGCGLDTSFSQINNGTVRGYNLDLPDVIEVRNELLTPAENEHNIGVDLNDTSWFDRALFQRRERMRACGVER